jgi:hypothetical protein
MVYIYPSLVGQQVSTCHYRSSSVYDKLKHRQPGARVYISPCGNRHNRAYFATQSVRVDMHEGDTDAWYQAAKWHAGLFTGGGV